MGYKPLLFTATSFLSLFTLNREDDFHKIQSSGIEYECERERAEEGEEGEREKEAGDLIVFNKD